jgi:hypothetical protein
MPSNVLISSVWLEPTAVFDVGDSSFLIGEDVPPQAYLESCVR